MFYIRRNPTYMSTFSKRCFWAIVPTLFFVGQVIAQDTAYSAYRPIITKNAARLGATTNDIQNAVITNAYIDASSGITFIYVQQAYKQIKVYNTIISAAFRNGSFLYASGTFVNDIDTKAPPSIPTITYADAVKAAARQLQLAEPTAIILVRDEFVQNKKYVVSPSGIAKQDIEVSLVYTPSDDKKQVTLSWNVNIDVLASADWWNARINAATAELIEKDNWTVNEHFDEQLPDKLPASTMLNKLYYPNNAANTNQLVTKQKSSSVPPMFLQAPPPNVASATYRVVPYPVESPIHSAMKTVTNPWLLSGASNNATTLGWHYDNTTNFTTTQGNNVLAHLDRQANDAVNATRNWPDTSTTAVPSLSFEHVIDFGEQPFKSVENKKGAVDNLFYWNNLMHDLTYQYGLTEVSGTFQKDNMGRGGLGNDLVIADAMDSAGYNNANFATPSDGQSGRMQMYTWSTPLRFSILGPENLAGNYAARESGFTAPNKLVNVGPTTGLVAHYNDDILGTIHNACAATAAANAANLAGKIVLIDAASCTAIGKVKKAQNAGAIAVLMYSATITTLIGTDNSVTIPTVSITTAVANSIIAQLDANVPVTATLVPGIYLDGDLDNGIICHEYGHGVSNRLTGGPANSSCLGNAEQGGEGWSDYFALMMTTDWSTAALTDGPKRRPMGTFAFAQPTTGAGIRRYPYSTDMTIDPLTYSAMALSTEVHNTGEIWCSALWDMTWGIIQQQNAITPNLFNSGGTGGNVIAMNLVMMGMKLQPCGPGFLDARNAILAADSILYNYEHKCAIWNAFAKRGMGASASQGLASSATDQVQAFDLPSGVRSSKASPSIVSINTQNTYGLTVECQCQPVTSYVIRDTIPAGFTYMSSSPLGFLNGNVLSFSADFAVNESKTFSVVLKAPTTGCLVDSSINDNRETTTIGGITTGTPGWTTSTVKSSSPTSSWFASESTAITSSSLTSAATALAATKNLSLLSFNHYFNTENSYDGGVVEYSTNGGSTWNDAAPLFIKNGYNAQMATSTTLTGRRAFTGTNSVFSPSLLNLTSLGNTAVSFRFRMETDNGTGGEGWFVDDITRINGCGAFLKTGIYNTAGIRVDTVMTPIFVTTQSPVPLTLLWFYATQVDGQVALDWKTVSEISVRDFAIEWSTDGENWTTIGTKTALNQTTNGYDYVHATPVKGNNFYRIKMNDRDGHYTYSPVRIINIKENGKPMLVLLPNPVSSDAILYMSKDIQAKTVKIFNAAGSLIQQTKIGTGVQQLKISTTELPAGVYMIETTGAGRFVTRMLVQH